MHPHSKIKFLNQIIYSKKKYLFKNSEETKEKYGFVRESKDVYLIFIVECQIDNCSFRIAFAICVLSSVCWGFIFPYRSHLKFEFALENRIVSNRILEMWSLTSIRHTKFQ